MDASELVEARLRDAGNALVALSELEDRRSLASFFGSVVTQGDLASGRLDVAGKTVYLCGDVTRDVGLDLGSAARVFVIEELSRGYGEDDGRKWSRVGLGRVPILVHGVGVYYRRFFDPGVDHFGRICAEHTFQTLRESTKPATAHRTGIYLTPVGREGDELHFRLLRCSTNLSGPTENFRSTDRHIVDALNDEASCVFQDHAPFNHVLAQIYRNTSATEVQRQTKARISEHADKTKDMPAAGIMAFCTFYQGLDKLRPLASDPFDYGYKENTGLTRLRFRLTRVSPFLSHLSPT